MATVKLVMTAEKCNYTSTEEHDIILIVMSSMGLISFCFCTFTTVLAFYLKLHKHFIYRLALYQVVSSLLISTDDVLVICLSSYVSEHNHLLHHTMCLATGFLLTYFIWIKLLFTTILTFHLFFLAVCLKDFKQCEVFYVVFSVLFPLTFTWIPFIGQYYGEAGGWCWIKDHNSDCSHNRAGIVEQYVLFYGPWYVCLAFSVMAAFVVLCVLIWKGCGKHRSTHNSNESESLLEQNNKQHKKALMEVIPLLAYPAIFFFFNIFAITHRIHNAFSRHPNFELALMHSFVNAAWGTLSSLALLAHILIAQCMKRRKIRLKSSGMTNINVNQRCTTMSPTKSGWENIFTSFTEISTHAKSYFVSPTESEGERNIAERL